MGVEIREEDNGGGIVENGAGFYREKEWEEDRDALSVSDGNRGWR